MPHLHAPQQREVEQLTYRNHRTRPTQRKKSKKLRSPQNQTSKLTCNPSCPALQKGCQDIDSAFRLHLNTASLSPNSFFFIFDLLRCLQPPPTIPSTLRFRIIAQLCK